jgi:hypothetical protein
MTTKQLQKPGMIQVNSSNIDKIGYDEENELMYVQFTNGGTYTYTPIKKKTWEEFKGSESKGSYIWKNIRNNKSIKSEKAD